MREATPMESSLWFKWVDRFEQTITPAVVRFQLASGFAADTQTWLQARGLGLSGGPIFTQTDLQKVQGTLNTYNALGRIMAAVNSGKYGINVYKGDIDVMAPLSMPKEQWEQDRLGAAFIIYALAVGGLVAAGMWAWSAIVGNEADKEHAKYKRELLQADKEMMKKPAPVRKEWIQFREKLQQQEAETKKQTGVLVDIFGSKIGGGIAIGGAVLLGLLALRFLPRGNR